MFRSGKNSSTRSAQPASAPIQPSPPVDLTDVNDPGYQRAATIRTLAENLHFLLTISSDGRLDWNAIKSHEAGGCTDIKVRFDQVIKSLQRNNRHAGQATSTAVGLARKGKDVCPLSSTLLQSATEISHGSMPRNWHPPSHPEAGAPSTSSLRTFPRGARTSSHSPAKLISSLDRPSSPPTLFCQTLPLSPGAERRSSGSAARNTVWQLHKPS